MLDMARQSLTQKLIHFDQWMFTDLLMGLVMHMRDAQAVNFVTRALGHQYS